MGSAADPDKDNPLPTGRPRDAALTREAIVRAARARFCSYGYEDAGLREIASDAGVDAALISRYFGSKEGLFETAFASCRTPDGPALGNPGDFGERLARQLVSDPKPDARLTALLMMLRSLGSAKTSDVAARGLEATFVGPIAEWLGGGPDATVRAHLITALITGMAVNREIAGFETLTPAQRAGLQDQLARQIQGLVTPPGAPRS